MKELREIFELRGRLEAMECKLEAAQKRIAALERDGAELHAALAKQARLCDAAKELVEGVRYYSRSIPDGRDRAILLQQAIVTKAAVSECDSALEPTKAELEQAHKPVGAIDVTPYPKRHHTK